MTDRSMFPNFAPDKANTTSDRAGCCEGLRPPPNVPARAWSFMHAVGHSRVPFTAEGFATVAECTGHQADVAIRHAAQHAWISAVLPERYMNDPIPQWVGVLPRRK